MDTEYLFTEMRDDGFTDAARIEDLGPNDFAKVGSRVRAPAFLSRFGFSPRRVGRPYLDKRFLVSL